MVCLALSIVWRVNFFLDPINVCSSDIVKCCKARKPIKVCGPEFFNDYIGHVIQRRSCEDDVIGVGDSLGLAYIS